MNTEYKVPRSQTTHVSLGDTAGNLGISQTSGPGKKKHPKIVQFLREPQKGTHGSEKAPQWFWYLRTSASLGFRPRGDTVRSAIKGQEWKKGEDNFFESESKGCRIIMPLLEASDYQMYRTNESHTQEHLSCNPSSFCAMDSTATLREQVT